MAWLWVMSAATMRPSLEQGQGSTRWGEESPPFPASPCRMPEGVTRLAPRVGRACAGPPQRARGCAPHLLHPHAWLARICTRMAPGGCCVAKSAWRRMPQVDAAWSAGPDAEQCGNRPCPPSFRSPCRSATWAQSSWARSLQACVSFTLTATSWWTSAVGALGAAGAASEHCLTALGEDWTVRATVEKVFLVF